MCKEKIYNIIAHNGIRFLQKFFPEYFSSEPLRPTDRFYEYPFILRNIFGGDVLDVGCSGSLLPILLKACGHDIRGIDIRDFPSGFDIPFTKGDIRNTDFKDKSFHYITAVSSIEHIGLKGCYGQKEDKEGDYKAIKEIYRILKNNGKFLMTVPYGDTFELTPHHKIYDKKTLDCLLYCFEWEMEIVKSPEADYQIALIKAEKNGGK